MRPFRSLVAVCLLVVLLLFVAGRLVDVRQVQDPVSLLGLLDLLADLGEVLALLESLCGATGELDQIVDI